jgi:DNA mismatch endonuclease, patch repair protein
MSAIHSKNTRPEKQVEKILRKQKIKYKKHYPIPGSPDFIVEEEKTAIFVDGDFWHGHNWKLRGIKDQKTELAGYNKYWSNKIQTNIKRDRRANRKLHNLGWKVVRFWESDIKNSTNKVIKKLKKII